MEDITAQLDALDNDSRTHQPYLSMNITDVTLGVDPSNYPEEVLREMHRRYTGEAEPEPEHREYKRETKVSEISTVTVEEVVEAATDSSSIVIATSSERVFALVDESAPSTFVLQTPTAPADPPVMPADPLPAETPALKKTEPAAVVDEDNIDNPFTPEELTRITEEIGALAEEIQYAPNEVASSKADAFRRAAEPHHPPGRVITYWDEADSSDDDDEVDVKAIVRRLSRKVEDIDSMLRGIADGIDSLTLHVKALKRMQSDLLDSQNVIQLRLNEFERAE